MKPRIKKTDIGTTTISSYKAESQHSLGKPLSSEITLKHSGASETNACSK